MSQQGSDLMMQMQKVSFGVKPYLELPADQQRSLKPWGRLAEQKFAPVFPFTSASYDS